MSDWISIRTMMDQLEQLCTTSADHDSLQLLRNTRSEMQNIFFNSETNVKRIILELQQDVATSQASIQELSEPLEQMLRKAMELEQKKEEISQQLSAMKEICDTSTASINNILNNTLQYKEMLQQLQSDQSTQVPRTRQFLNLYANISAIRWNYDSRDIEGFIAPPNDSPIRSFKFDASHSPKQIADALWDSIAVAHGIPFE